MTPLIFVLALVLFLTMASQKNVASAFVVRPYSSTSLARGITTPNHQSNAVAPLQMAKTEAKILIKGPELERGEDGKARVPILPAAVGFFALFASMSYKMRENKERVAKKKAKALLETE